MKNIFIILTIILIFLIINYIFCIIKKYLLTQEINISERYGKNTWVLITGCSSGQGERFAYEFAKRNFNIILLGSKKIENIEKNIKKKYKVKTISYVTDFCKAYKKNYFKPIENILDNLDGELSFLVNNIGHRTGWDKYHEMPQQKINDTIVCGTIVQSRLTQIAIKQFNKRINKKYKSSIINITSMCITPSVFFGTNNHITIPFLSVYESANAFGFYHSNSIQKEYEEYIDVLNITPGAVITKNTEYLRDVPFAIDCKTYVKNIFKLIGNYTGPQHAYWKHELSGLLFYFLDSNNILKNTGKKISEYFMEKYKNYKIK